MIHDDCPTLATQGLRDSTVGPGTVTATAAGLDSDNGGEHLSERMANLVGSRRQRRRDSGRRRD